MFYLMKKDYYWGGDKWVKKKEEAKEFKSVESAFKQADFLDQDNEYMWVRSK